jgi:branched-chain amino acid transport system permease protein
MQLIANIVTLAALYALIASGYVVVYRVSRVLNLAHGEIMMIGAYLLLTAGTIAGGPPAFALPLALAASLLTGVVVYIVLMRRMSGEAVFAAVLMTIALGILLRGLASLLWTGRLHHPAPLVGWSNVPVHLPGGAAVSSAAAFTVVGVVLVYAGLFGALRYTRWGQRLRAVGENPRLAAQRGVAPASAHAIAWALAAFTGGLAGMLLSLDQGLDASVAIVGLKTFPVVLVGGLDSLLGALAGALIVAAAEALAIHYVDPLVSEVAPFLVLITMLMVRPWGLFGAREEIDRV